MNSQHLSLKWDFEKLDKYFSEMLLRIVLSFDLIVKKLLVKSRTFLRVGEFYEEAKSNFQ